MSQKNDSLTLSILSSALIVHSVFVIAGTITSIFQERWKRSQRIRQDSNTSNNCDAIILTRLLVHILPEDWRGNLEALRYELIAAKKSRWHIRFITAVVLLDMLRGSIRIKLDNLYSDEFGMAAISSRTITDNKKILKNHDDSNE